MSRTRARFAACVVALSTALVTPVVAYAQDPNPAALAKAREEFRRGLALEAAGDWEGALHIFKGVALVKSTPQVRFHIAQAEEKTGDLVGAVGSYRLAAYEAREAKVKDVEAASDAALKTIEPRVPKLTIRRGAGAAVARVTLDGRELGNASIGTVMNVNPGPHRIEASAPGYETMSVELSLAPGEKKEQALALKEKPAAAAEAGATPGRPDEGGPPPPTKTSPVKIAGFVIGGAGVVSLGVAGVFFVIRQGAISDLDASCGPDGKACPANQQSTFDRGKMASTVTTATLIGGAAAVAIGGIMIIAAPKPKPKPSVGVAALPGGAALVGTF